MGGRGSAGCDVIGEAGDSNSYSGLNADGSTGYNPSIDVPNNQCWQARNQHPTTSFNFNAIALDPFAYNNITTSGIDPAATGAIGSGLTFMRDQWLPNQLAGSSRNVLWVPQGVGGTGLCAGATPYWAAPPASNSGGLDIFIDRANAAIALDARNILKMVLWSTGANDAINGIATNTYLTAFAAAAAYMRANLTGGTNIPIIIQGLVPAWVATNTGTFGGVDDALKAIPANVAKTGYIDMTGCLGQTATPYHLTAASKRLVGGSAGYAAYLAALAN